ncbi:MAG: Crp/Fnr family transcriptional regulator [Eubacteriales bacterium]|nr:Crp/Fnr family transcriptional regulator [Eubacteriales bacterium]
MKLNEKYYEILKSSILFAGLKEVEMKEALIILGASFREYERGDVLHRAFSPVKNFGLVLEGTVNVCSDDLEGNRMIMASVQPGSTFAEALYFLKVKDSPMYAEATDCVSALWLSTDKLFGTSKAGAKADIGGRLCSKEINEFSDTSPKLIDRMQKNFVSLLAGRTLSMNDRIQVLSKLTLREKLKTYFSEMSGQTGGLTFNVPFNREDMATYLGTNRSALSRELAKMKAEGLIDFYRNSFRILK